MNKTILNHEYIKNSITKNNGKDDVKYRWSHGAMDKHLGDGMIIYSMMYFFKPIISVCLGSGGGYIPRIMWSCISDLEQEGFNTDDSRVILVDAVNEINGHPDWTDENSFYRKKFLSEWLHTTTEEAYYEFFVKRDMKIDMLWVDADHTFEGVKKDFDLYSQIISDNGIIMIHDTDEKYVDNFIETEEHEDYDLSGPSKFIKTLDSDKFEILNLFNYGIEKDFPSSTGLTIVRKK